MIWNIGQFVVIVRQRVVLTEMSLDSIKEYEHFHERVDKQLASNYTWHILRYVKMPASVQIPADTRKNTQTMFG